MTENHDQIVLMLGEIRGEVKGINQRLDISNGRLAKHDSSIQSLQEFQARHSGETKIIGVIWGSLSALGVSLMVWFLTKRI